MKSGMLSSVLEGLGREWGEGGKGEREGEKEGGRERGKEWRERGRENVRRKRGEVEHV